MKVAIVLGTRPEIIKMSPIIYELKKRKIIFYIIHTGQHYSYNMDKIFFDQLQLPKPKKQPNPVKQNLKIKKIKMSLAEMEE